jgi:hypothetical protein
LCAFSRWVDDAARSYPPLGGKKHACIIFLAKRISFKNRNMQELRGPKKCYICGKALDTKWPMMCGGCREKLRFFFKIEDIENR